MIEKFLKSKSKGYTLIEILVSLAIFSMMVILVGYTFSQLMNNFKKITEKGFNIWENAKYLWLSNLFISMSDYYVYSKIYGWYPFFEGFNDRIIFITLSPINGEYPSIVFIIKEPVDNGKYNLVVYEKRVFSERHEDLISYFYNGEYKKWSKIEILTNSELISFEFYGYDILDKKFRWSNNYESAKTKYLPMFVKIIYYVEGEKKQITLTIKNNSIFKWYYNDVYKIK